MDENRMHEDDQIEDTLRALERAKKREEERLDEKPSLGKELLSFLGYAVFVFLAAFLIITFVGQRTQVQGPSMYDTLEDGDNLIVEKLSYRFGDPERFDIVVFKYAHKDHTYYIKRVIGLPGETVQIIGDEIYINGELLEEDYGYEPMISAGRASEPITLGENEYFVLGDNRNNSSDSRDPSVGNVQRAQLIGKAWVRIWPLAKFGKIEHR